MKRIEEEIWKDVKDYEGRYQVSNQGRVKRLYHRSGKERVISPEKVMGGYLRVNLYKNGKAKHISVHRLVAQTFIPNTENWPEVNHKDEVKTNNSVANLEWCSKAYNCQYGTRTERMMLTRNTRKSYGAEQAVVATRNGIERWFRSQHEASQQLGLNQGCIHYCLVGRQHHTGGWSFRLAAQTDRPAVESLF